MDDAKDELDHTHSPVKASGNAVHHRSTTLTES